eukprot:gb/GECH01003010.1/.p1 GENE.gb/GECH01003010.1/~~gb/GECH01003010.1/.p1  ORF type:complete len:103 (+),score=32.47 gb/GECH01003010.1/:1-309(+)
MTNETNLQQMEEDMNIIKTILNDESSPDQVRKTESILRKRYQETQYEKNQKEEEKDEEDILLKKSPETGKMLICGLDIIVFLFLFIAIYVSATYYTYSIKHQ